MKHLRVGIDLDAMDRRAGGSVPPPAHVSPAIGEFAIVELARVTAAVRRMADEYERIGYHGVAYDMRAIVDPKPVTS